MIEFQAGQEFLVAVPRRYQQDEVIEAHGLKGRIVEEISGKDYLEVWAFRGFPSEGVSAMRPRFYYRCIKLPTVETILKRLGAEQRTTPEMKVCGEQESA